MKAILLEGDAINPGDISWDPITSVCDTRIYANTTEANKWERLNEAEIILDNKIIIDEAVLTRFPQIRYVGVCATGYNVIDLAACRRHGVTVTNVPAYSTESVAQMTWALSLELASKVSLHADSVARGDWCRSAIFTYGLAPISEVAGKTLGIYGFGHIGREVAKIGQAFGMSILVHTAHPDHYKTYACDTLRFVDADTLYRQSDILSFHCPLTPETDRIVNRDNIAKMKDGITLINVSRGGLVDEAALAEALASGKVGAAGVDVVSREPIIPNNPLLAAPHCLILPHIGWASKEARERLVATIGANLKGWLAGAPSNVVS